MKYIQRFLFLALLCALVVPGFAALAQQPVVNAVLFYSPTCGHCEKVINEDLPPLFEQYKDQLQMIGVNVTTERGQMLYQNFLREFSVPDDRIGVPTLVVGDTYLIGSFEIPNQFPGMIAAGLENGGITWPAISGLDELLAEARPEPEPAPLTMSQRFAQDLTGNILSVIILIGMLASLGVIAFAYIRFERFSLPAWPSWVIPVLALLGLGVAVYLSYVEVTQTEAVCGPIGDCNTVQQSPYARLFGLLPIGVLGALGYIAMLLAWLAQYYGGPNIKRQAALALWGMTLFGVAFSAYLTFLEPFVIGATCAWCLSSAIIVTLLMWAATPPALAALRSRTRPRPEGLPAA
ncbi:MAG TPA: vitamin K epoxide reductase family protein [Anaerolineales bacterium]|nr:vitamin K epoxide reductase family protein [Anaerolineales bacterium]